MKPTAHTESLWTLEQEIRVPGIRLRLPLRSTLIRLSPGGLLVISPLPRIAEAAEEIRNLGEVKALVAPNLAHHLGLSRAHALFPEARVFARPGMGKVDPKAPVTDALRDAPDALWAEDVDQHTIGGIKKSLDEVAFFHRPSRTLVLTDLCFHVMRLDHWPSRVFLRLNHAYGRFGPTRVIRSLITDRAALRASVAHLLSWNPERIIVGHGDVVEENAPYHLEKAFDFLR